MDGSVRWASSAKLPSREQGALVHLKHVPELVSQSQVRDRSDIRPLFTAGHLPTLYDFHFDATRKKWIPWSQLVPDYVHSPERRFIDILGKREADPVLGLTASVLVPRSSGTDPVASVAFLRPTRCTGSEKPQRTRHRLGQAGAGFCSISPRLASGTRRRP